MVICLELWPIIWYIPLIILYSFYSITYVHSYSYSHIQKSVHTYLTFPQWNPIVVVQLVGTTYRIAYLKVVLHFTNRCQYGSCVWMSPNRITVYGLLLRYTSSACYIYYNLLSMGMALIMVLLSLPMLIIPCMYVEQ